MADVQLPDHNRLIRERYDKVDALREEGIEPYPRRYDVTHKSNQVLEEFEAGKLGEDAEVAIAGRVLSIRRMGKSAFFHLLDVAGRIQVYIRPDTCDEAGYNLFRTHIDMGDIVGVRGTVFRTRTGEITVMAKQFDLLTKSTRPLPEKWHGLKDVETRYRQRYVDLIVNEDVRKTFLLRSRMIAAIRRFLDGEGYVEVETPMLQPIYGGAAARPFVTHHNTLDMDLYLRIAPELYHKRLVVGGIEKVYEINRNFRNEGISTRHNPEFTMVELYTAYWDYTNTMDLTERIYEAVLLDANGSLQLTYQGMELDFTRPWRRATILELAEEKSGEKFSWGDPPEQVAERLGLDPDYAKGKSTARLLIDYFEEHIEGDLVGPIFVCDFPAELSPLAKRKADDPFVAERFELFVGKLESANAYSELNDPAEQYLRFKEQVEMRAAGDAEAHAMDEDYVRALEYGMPPASGLGIGIDRLAMLLTDSSSIRDVILFPTLRPEVHGALESDEPDGSDVSDSEK